MALFEHIILNMQGTKGQNARNTKQTLMLRMLLEIDPNIHICANIGALLKKIH
jgi:hypothetical protein